MAGVTTTKGTTPMTYLSVSIVAPEIVSSGDHPTEDIVHVELSRHDHLSMQGTLAALVEFHATLGAVLADVKSQRREAARQVLVDGDEVAVELARVEELTANGATVPVDDPFGTPTTDLTADQLDQIGF